MPRYAELHCHTEFSFLDGASSADDLVDRAAQFGIESLAVTDHQGLYGAIRFVTAAQAAGIHPVVGVEIELLDAAVPDPHALVVPERRRARKPVPARAEWEPWDADRSGVDVGGREASPAGRPDSGRPVHPRAERVRLPGHREHRREDLRGVGDRQRGPHLVLLARDQAGYRNLSRLVSAANLAGSKGVPRFTHALLERHAEGVVALSGCRHGEIARRLLAGDREGAAEAAKRYARMFGGSSRASRGPGDATSSGTSRGPGISGIAGISGGPIRPRRGQGPIGGFVLELQHHLLPDDDWLVAETVRLAAELGLPVAVTNDVHYALPEDRELQDVMVAIRHGLTLDESAHLRRPNGEFRMKPAAGLLALPPGDGDAAPAIRRAWSEGMTTAAEIAEACRIDLGFEQYRFPGFEVPKGETPFSHLEALCHEGARRRYHPLTPRVLTQLAHELDVISRTGLAEFFLICWDLMQFARGRGIPAQGRGSAGDSIVAYVLGITRVDPIRHNLLFERFINEGRTSYPDVDIDFASSRREEVIQYVYEHYGSEHTGMVCNVITYRARSAVREVGYALGFPRPLVDRVAKALETYDSVMVRRDLEAEGGFAEFFALPEAAPDGPGDPGCAAPAGDPGSAAAPAGDPRGGDPAPAGDPRGGDPAGRAPTERYVGYGCPAAVPGGDVGPATRSSTHDPGGRAGRIGAIGGREPRPIGHTVPQEHELHDRQAQEHALRQAPRHELHDRRVAWPALAAVSDHVPGAAGPAVSPGVARAVAASTGFVDEMGQLNHARGGRWRRAGHGLSGAGPDANEHGDGRPVRREDVGRIEAGEARHRGRSDDEGGPGDTPVSIAWLRAEREHGPARALEVIGRGSRAQGHDEAAHVPVDWVERRAVPDGPVEPTTSGRAASDGPVEPTTSRNVLSGHAPHSSVARLEPEPPPERRTGSTTGLSPWERWLELCARIDGRPRHLGIHVGGMLVTAAPLVEIAPLERASMPGRVVVQFDKRDVETMKLIKLDLLGLRMLSAIDDTLRDVTADCGVVLDLDRLPEDLPDVFRMIRAADTTGVFQIESRAQMQTLPKSAPTTLDDLVVEVAIIRPGPIQGNAVHPYLRRRQGLEPVAYLHPSLEPILRETLGVILYQEQVMEIAIHVAGFSAAESDGFRRAMGTWRSSREMEKLHRRFVEGCGRVCGLDDGQAEELFRQVAAFASFGFNKSHAAAFARTAYESAFLKLYYPAQFTAGLINNQPMGFYPVEVLVNDAKRHGVAVLPVDVNRSRFRTTTEWVGMPGRPLPEGCGIERRPPVVRSSGCIVPDRRTRRQLAAESAEGYGIRLGLHLVKGIGQEHADLLDGELERRPYRSLADVVARTGLAEEVIERLIRAGALDSLGRPRRELLWQLREVAASTGRTTTGATTTARTTIDAPGPARDRTQTGGPTHSNREHASHAPANRASTRGTPTNREPARSAPESPASVQPARSAPESPASVQPARSEPGRSAPESPAPAPDPADRARAETYVGSGDVADAFWVPGAGPLLPSEHESGTTRRSLELIKWPAGAPIRHTVPRERVLQVAAGSGHASASGSVPASRQPAAPGPELVPPAESRTEPDLPPEPRTYAPAVLDLRLPPTDAPDLPSPTEVERLADSYAILSLDARRQVVELFRPALDHLGVATNASLADRRPGRVRIAGLVVTRQHPMTARGTVFLALEDETAMVNVTLWPDQWARFRSVVRRHALLWVDGELQREASVVNVVAHDVRALPAIARTAGGPEPPGGIRAQGYSGLRRG